jgi:hypothetical protein
MHKECHDAHDEWITISILTKTSLDTRLPSKNSSIQITLKAILNQKVKVSYAKEQFIISITT